MKTIKTFILAAVLFLAPVVRQAVAQQPQPGVQLQAVTGSSPNLIASIAGTQGTTVAYYVLIANFAGGSVASNILTINNVPNTLSASNYVSFLWSPVAGVVTYDLLKLTSAALPTGSNSVVLRAALAATVTVTTDEGGSLSSYTIAAPPATSVGLLQVNSRDYTKPQFDIATSSGTTIPGVAIAGVPQPIVNISSSASATGITLSVTQLINSVFSHAAGGAVADTTPTATAIIAALPSCYVSGATRSRFTFTLLNTTAGATAITVTGGSGVTVVGTAAIAQNFAGNFIGYVTNCATPAVTLTSIGTTAF